MTCCTALAARLRNGGGQRAASWISLGGGVGRSRGKVSQTCAGADRRERAQSVAEPRPAPDQRLALFAAMREKTNCFWTVQIRASAAEAGGSRVRFAVACASKRTRATGSSTRPPRRLPKPLGRWATRERSRRPARATSAAPIQSAHAPAARPQRRAAMARHRRRARTPAPRALAPRAKRAQNFNKCQQPRQPRQPVACASQERRASRQNSLTRARASRATAVATAARHCGPATGSAAAARQSA